MKEKKILLFSITHGDYYINSFVFLETVHSGITTRSAVALTVTSQCKARIILIQ